MQALQGSPSDRDIIDLYGHYGPETMAVNEAMRRRYDEKNEIDLKKVIEVFCPKQ